MPALVLVSVVVPVVPAVLDELEASVEGVVGVVVAVDGEVVEVLEPVVEASSVLLPQAVRASADIRARAAIEADFIRTLLAFRMTVRDGQPACCLPAILASPGFPYVVSYCRTM
jgi:hypothetical protein